MKHKLQGAIAFAALAFLSFKTDKVLAQYCTGGPSSTSDSNVEQVDITGENATSISHTGCPGVIGVDTLTAQSVELMPGNSYSMDITFGTCGLDYPGVGAVWIDYNQNQVFDSNELIGSSSGTPGSGNWSGPVTFNFTVPYFASAGSTRMRVLQEEGGSLPANSCSSFSWGSLMDFTADILQAPQVKDAGISGINQLGSSCDLALSDSVRIDIFNNGTVDIDTIYSYYVVNGTDTVVDSVYTTITPGSTYTYAFDDLIDASNEGLYTVESWIDVPNDSVASNDTLSQPMAFYHITTYSSLPYLDDFDDAYSEWNVEGASPSWARGIPNNTTINSAASSPNAWVTNLTGSYNSSEDSYLYSPCFDFSNLTVEPNVRFDLWRASESGYDGMQLQVSLDTGNTWIPVGSDTTGMNWYNNSNTFGGTFSPDFLWDGDNNGWVEVEHELDSLMGEPSVQFRFNFKSDIVLNYEGVGVDNFAISPYPELNVNDTVFVCQDGNYNPQLGEGTYEWLSENSQGASVIQSDSVYSFIGEDEFFITQAELDYENIAGFGLVDTIVLAHYPRPMINTPDTGLCQGEQMQIEVITNLADTTFNNAYNWSTGGSQQQININNPGQYSVTVVDPFGCNFSDTVQLAGYPDPSVNLGSDTVICEGEELLITAGTGFSSYNWSTNSTTDQINVEQSGTYVVTVTNQFGCENVDDKTVTVLDPPNIDLGGDINDGPGIYTFDAGSGYESYIWSNGDSTQTTEYGIASSNTVWVEVTDENGCVGRDEIFIDVIMSNEEKLAQVDSWKVYPNPAKTRTTIQINLNHEAQVDLTVMSTTGAVVDRIQKGLSAGQNQINLPLSNLESGVYFIDARIDGESLGQMKLIKQ
ncbi:T9SS type A sorting domain-containing protein [Salibacter halophilus]|uniref:T9SS type A sorting domain-containing protein n=1 Tax=Salibacter halophilus TaxID=1803916 RepID=A0A6N6M3R9_9FLAO|nr:T9SS type A sorting domain-containing protein [Salibacter halophilus]KAB1063930.1 T9SS type A sorting domain-containing protein [Salibacter halophilus]